MVADGGSSNVNGIRVPERVIPMPRTISPEAQAVLTSETPPSATLPSREDKAGWQKHIDAINGS